MLNNTPAPRRGTAAAQWLEGPNYGMAPTTLMKEYFAYHASQHDRASDGLKKAVFEWCEVSGYMGPGDRVKVTEEASPVFGMTGTVKRVLIHNEKETMNSPFYFQNRANDWVRFEIGEMTVLKTKRQNWHL